MPQLDFSTYVPQLFWLAVSFFVLYLLMRLVALPRVGATIDLRRARLDEDLARAAETRAQAQDAIRQTAERAAVEAAQRHRQLADALAEQIRGAERQIAAAKDQAFSEIRGLAIDVARSLADKLAGAQPDEPSLAAAVDRAMAERAA